MATRYIGQNYASWNGMYYTTLVGADRYGTRAEANIYLEEEYDTTNKRSRVRIIRIAMSIPPHSTTGAACSKTDLYKTSTATGSWVKLNGETLFNCTQANQYGLNLQVSGYTSDASAVVKPYSNYNASSFDGQFQSSWSNWIYYSGAKSISLQGYFTWATAGSTPYDTTGGINTSTTVSLYTMPTAYTVTVQDRVSSSSGTLLGSGTYSVNSGTTVSASSLRSTTYTGYTYSSSTSATISGATTLYRYFTPVWSCGASEGTTTVPVQNTDNSSGSSYVGLINGTSHKFSRFPVAFTTSGKYKIYSAADNNVDVKGWLSSSSNFSSSTGEPSSSMAYDDDGAGNRQYSLSVTVNSGTTYYVFTKPYSESTGSTNVTINIVPNYSFTTVSGLTDLSSPSSKAVTLSAGDVQIIPVSFAYSGTAKFSSSSGLYTYGFLSSSSSGSTTTGKPGSVLASDGAKPSSSTTRSGGTVIIGGATDFSFYYNVTAGTTYYLFVRGYSMDTSGDVTVNITPPSKPAANVTVTADDGIASVSGGGKYDIGTTVTVTAVVSEMTSTHYYTFDGWYDTVSSDDGIIYNKVSSDLTYSFTAAEDVSLTARSNVHVRMYDITFNSDEHCRFKNFSIDGLLIASGEVNGMYAECIPAGDTMSDIHFEFELDSGYWAASYILSGVDSNGTIHAHITVSATSKISPRHNDSDILSMPYIGSDMFIPYISNGDLFEWYIPHIQQ